jgi:hypothetical protein
LRNQPKKPVPKHHQKKVSKKATTELKAKKKKRKEYSHLRKVRVIGTKDNHKVCQRKPSKKEN